MFAEALESIDPSVALRHVVDGQAVLSLLNTSETKPDIIFLDLNMPAILISAKQEIFAGTLLFIFEVLLIRVLGPGVTLVHNG